MRRITARRSASVAAAVAGSNSASAVDEVQGATAPPVVFTRAEKEFAKHYTENFMIFRRRVGDWLAALFDPATYDSAVTDATKRAELLKLPDGFKGSLKTRHGDVYFANDPGSRRHSAVPSGFHIAQELAADPPADISLLGALLAIAIRYDLLTEDLSTKIFNQLLRSTEVEYSPRDMKIGISQDGKQLIAKIDNTWFRPSGEAVLNPDGFHLFE